MVKLLAKWRKLRKKVIVLLRRVENDANISFINLTKLSAVIFQISSPKLNDTFFSFGIVLRYGYFLVPKKDTGRK